VYIPELEKIQRALQIQDARENLIDWCEFGPVGERGKFVRYKWQEHLCTELEEFAYKTSQGLAPRMIVCAPPQFGKSEIVSRRFPVWYLGNYGGPIAIASCDAPLALEHSRSAREMSSSDEAFDVWPDIRTKKASRFGYRRNDTDLVASWTVGNELRGRYIAVGIGQTLTGRSPQLIIIDDPFKDKEQAYSSAYRNRVWDWIKFVVFPRARANGSGIIFMHTRWHEDDAIGRLLKDELDGGDQWQSLIYRNECEDEDDPLGRQVGELLNPLKMNEEATRLAKRHSREYYALYQQRPTSVEGNIIQRKWVKFYKELPAKFDKIIQSWDCAIKDKETSDYVAGQVWGKAGGEYYLLGRIHERMGFDATIKAIRSTTIRYPAAIGKYIEDKANGSPAGELLKKEISGIILKNPKGSKANRLKSIQPLFEAGNVYLPDSSIEPTIWDMVEEVVGFTDDGASTKHDDEVDSMTQALVELAGLTGTPTYSRPAVSRR